MEAAGVSIGARGSYRYYPIHRGLTVHKATFAGTGRIRGARVRSAVKIGACASAGVHAPTRFSKDDGVARTVQEIGHAIDGSRISLKRTIESRLIVVRQCRVAIVVGAIDGLVAGGRRRSNCFGCEIDRRWLQIRRAGEGGQGCRCQRAVSGYGILEDRESGY